MTQWTLDKGLLKYVNTREQADLEFLADSIAQQYEQSGNWEFLRQRVRHEGPTVRRPRPTFKDMTSDGRRREQPSADHFRPLENHGRFPPPPFRPPPRNGNMHPPPLSQKLIVVDAQRSPVVGLYDEQKHSEESLVFIPIQVSEELYGWIVHRPPGHLSDDFDLSLISALKNSFLSISLLALFLSAALALPLSYLLLRRIKSLSSNAKQITSGDYSARVQAGANDELGELGDNFNRLAQTLEANESARKRWVADISHELRTPLSIASGELEAMIDGVREVGITNLQSAHSEIKHLNRLVDDLYQLSNADIGALNYVFETLDLAKVLENETRGLDALAQKSGLTIHCDFPSKPCVIHGDLDRIKQLLNNLISNATKYTTAPGKITLTLKKQKKNVILTINDTAPGVKDTDLPKLFDPLYRTEQSRNRNTGGSGLGLGICQRIVLGHQGSIQASHSSLGGLQITIHLPCV